MSFRTSVFGVLFLCAVLSSTSSWAQRVVVLEFDNDRQGKLRKQVESALRRADVVEVVPLRDYERAADKRNISAGKMARPSSVAKVAPALELAAVVTGSVDKVFSVSILDSRGDELWAKDLRVSKGLLSTSFAAKLAKAIAAAARKGEKIRRQVEAPEEPEDEPRRAAVEQPNPPERRVRPEEEQEGVVMDPNISIRTEAPPRDPDLEEEEPRKRAEGPVRVLTLSLLGSTTWRSYCSRPGVSDCRAYDSLPEGDRPRGDTVDFSPQAPYAGFFVGANLFPMAALKGPVRGFGLNVGYGQGFSQTFVKVTTPTGESPEKTVISTEQAIEASLLYRLFFPMGKGLEAGWGYVGLRGGYGFRTFKVDKDATVPLPGSDRRFPMAGIDLSIPLARMVRMEGAGTWLFTPRETGVRELERYGSPSTATGFSFEAGLAGDIWGPLGYLLRFRYHSFADRFLGNETPGTDWVCEDVGQCGGAAQESYSTLHWGLTASF